MRSMLAKAMSCVLFNYIEPKGITPTPFAYFGQKMYFGGMRPKVDMVHKTVSNQLEGK